MARVLAMQRAAGNSAVARYLQPRAVQRDDQAPESAPADPAGGTAASDAAAGPPGLIVEDSAPDPLDPTQLRRTAFIGQVRSAVTDQVGPLISFTPMGATFNEQLDEQAAKYGGTPAAALEREVRKAVPAAAGMTSAPDLVGAVARDAVEQAQRNPLGGADTESDTGLPADDKLMRIAFKARNGVSRPAAEATSTRAALGSGRPLDAGVAGQVGGLYGADLSGVRIHTDERAAGTVESMGARAFTVGSDIAFAGGEYQPGTLVGDALLAHELAHVVQQGAGTHLMAENASHDDSGLEEEADVAAAAAVMSARGIRGTLSALAGRVTPSLRAGLRVQRCTKPAPKNQCGRPVNPKLSKLGKSSPGYGMTTQTAWTMDPPGSNPMSTWTRENVSEGTPPNPPFADVKPKNGPQGEMSGRLLVGDQHYISPSALVPLDQMVPGTWVRHQKYDWTCSNEKGLFDPTGWQTFDENDLIRTIRKSDDGAWHLITTVTGNSGKEEQDDVIT
ncbi:eCIS core domain-containing protein [Actinophytocola sp.]|uniref:eCIS core domain-containing protein n=1 Tax=Actinophytocola sp. TaxID=1872138 RepID=UPI002E184D70